MRAIWKGHIRFSLVTIPIRIYTAIESGYTIRFNQLSKENKNPVTYEKKDKVTGETLGKDDIVKGYQYEPGQYIVVEPEEIEKIKPKSNRVIEIQSFVSKSDVHPTLFDTPYYIGPDGEIAAKTYELLKKALDDTDKVAVGKVTLRDRENIVLLNPLEKGIVMYKLRYPQEVRDINQVPQLNGKEDQIDKEQLKLAKTLIDSMSKPFEEVDMADNYHEALLKLIEAKLEGKEIVSHVEEEPQTVDIMTALKQSIDQAKSEKKPMKKATGRKKKEETKEEKSKSRSKKTG